MSEHKKKIDLITRRISFLMEHQRILPELRELANELKPDEANPSEYLLGAFEALTALITSLEEKSCNRE